MNRKQIFRAAGAAVLVVAGAFVGHANAKFAQITKLYYTIAGGSCHALQSSGVNSTLLTTGNTGSLQATLKTAGGHFAKLYSTIACQSASAVHFNGVQ